MTELKQQACEPCSGDTPTISEDRLNELAAQLPDWEVVTIDGEQQLRRRFACKDFAQALALANRIGEIAEAEQHHPALLVEYGACTVRWWTHKIGGLHENDFVMAARTDDVAAG